MAYPHQRSPSGEAYLASLVDCLQGNQDKLLSGDAALRLQPRALEYVAVRIEGLQCLQQLKLESPVEYLHARVADLEDYARCERLQALLARVKWVKLSAPHRWSRDPTCVDLTPFSSLTIVELTDCDLSTCVWRGLRGVQGTVRRIVVRNSLEALHHLLAPTSSGRAQQQQQHHHYQHHQQYYQYHQQQQLGGGPGGRTPRTNEEGDDSTTPPCWSSLSRLAASYNSLGEMDESLRLLPKLAELSLTNNNLQRVANLQHCTSLTCLELGFNRIRDASGIADGARTLRRVSLQGNALTCTEGLDALLALEYLDLRDNLIASFRDMVEVCKLPRLVELRMAGNPLAQLPSYRVGALSLFSSPGDVVLDEERPSHRELCTLATGRGCIQRAFVVSDAIQLQDNQLLWHLPMEQLPDCGPSSPASASSSGTSPLAGMSPLAGAAGAVGARLGLRSASLGRRPSLLPYQLTPPSASGLVLGRGGLGGGGLGGGGGLLSPPSSSTRSLQSGPASSAGSAALGPRRSGCGAGQASEDGAPPPLHLSGSGISTRRFAEESASDSTPVPSAASSRRLATMRMRSRQLLLQGELRPVPLYSTLSARQHTFSSALHGRLERVMVTEAASPSAAAAGGRAGGGSHSAAGSSVRAPGTVEGESLSTLAGIAAEGADSRGGEGGVWTNDALDAVAAAQGEEQQGGGMRRAGLDAAAAVTGSCYPYSLSGSSDTTSSSGDNVSTMSSSAASSASPLVDYDMA